MLILGQTVCSTGHSVAIRIQTVSSEGQDVVISGHTVITVPQIVSKAGHSVSISGQIVGIGIMVNCPEAKPQAAETSAIKATPVNILIAFLLILKPNDRAKRSRFFKGLSFDNCSFSSPCQFQANKKEQRLALLLRQDNVFPVPLKVEQVVIILPFDYSEVSAVCSAGGSPSPP